MTQSLHVLLVLICVGTLAFARPTLAAEDSCAPTVGAWLATCAKQHPLAVRKLHCGAGHLLVELATDAGPLAIDVVPGEHGFRRAGPFALSPVVDVPDWEAQPAARRDALEHLAACFSADPNVPRFAAPASPPLRTDLRPPLPRDPPTLPFRLLLGATLAWALLFPLLRRARLPALVLGVLAPLLTFFGRRLLFPLALFHQNSHGAEWIRNALGAPNRYGPGYHELFSWVTVRAPPGAPESAVFLLQGAFAAWQPTFAWILARSAGAPRNFAWVVAALVAFDPALGRLSGSESYLGLAVSLLFAAAAILAGAPLAAGRANLLRRCLTYCAAGLVVAQLARVHPLAWLPSAGLPLVVFARHPLRTRVLEAMLAGAVIGGVVALTAGPGMYAVATVVEFQHFYDRGQANVAWALLQPWILPGLATAALLVWRRKHDGAWLPVAWLPATFGLQTLMHLQHAEPRPQVFREALLLPFAPLWVTCAAALAGHLPALRFGVRQPTRSWTAALLLVLGIIAGAARWQAVVQLPTDVLESQAWLKLRTTLGPRDAVLTLDDVPQQQMVFDLPLYPGLPGQPALVLSIRGKTQLPELPPSTQRIFYYRSSLCTTAFGKPLCDAFEQHTPLQQRWSATLPTIPSMPHARYLAPTCTVGLFEVASPDKR